MNNLFFLLGCDCFKSPFSPLQELAKAAANPFSNPSVLMSAVASRASAVVRKPSPVVSSQGLALSFLLSHLSLSSVVTSFLLAGKKQPVEGVHEELRDCGETLVSSRPISPS